MAMPRAAQQKLEEAKELHRQMYEQDTSQDTPQGNDGNQHDEPTEAVQQTTNAPDDPEQQAQPPADQGHAEPDSLEERYRKLQAAHSTLQGKYRAEVPRLQQENSTLRAQLANAQSAQANAEQSAKEAKADLGKVVERMRDEVGDDASSVIREYADTLVTEKMDSLRKETHEERVARFWKDVRRGVTDFDAVNASPEFVQWLQATNDLETGLTYQDSINQAGSELDAFAVIDIVKQFKREQTQRAAPPTPPAPTAEDYVSPQRQPSPPQTEQKPQYTPQDFAVLQDEIRRGLWKGKEVEARALEREIHAALIG